MEQNIQNDEHEQSNFVLTESFTIPAEEAADILGVNRARLSQLTTKGIFAYERRKVENHNRLFYRLNDLLNYQREHTYGNLHVKWKPKDQIIVAPAITAKTNTSDIENKQEHNPTAMHPSKRAYAVVSRHKEAKKSALEQQTSQQLIQKVECLQAQLNEVKSTLTQILSAFEQMHMRFNQQDLKLSQKMEGRKAKKQTYFDVSSDQSQQKKNCKKKFKSTKPAFKSKTF